MKYWLTVVLALFVILECESIWKFEYLESSRNRYIIFVNAVIILCVLLLMIFSTHKICETKIVVIGELYLIGLAFINFCIYKLNNALLFIVPTAILLVYLMQDSNITRLFDTLYNLIVIIALISLVCYVLFSLLHVISAPKTFIMTRSNYPQQIKSFYIYFIPQQMGDFDRNCAFFYEAPKYNLLLTIALAYSLFIRNELFTKKNIIIMITIISALSVTGVIIGTGMTIIRIVQNIKEMSKQKLLILIGIGFPIIIVLLVVLFNVYQAKTQTGSYMVRMMDYYIGYLTWIEKPLFGQGIGNTSVLDSYILSLRGSGLGFSNGIFRILVNGGLYLFLFFFIPYIKYMKKVLKHRNYNYFIFGIVFFVLLVTTSFTNNTIYSICIIFFTYHGYATTYIEDNSYNI